MADVLSRKFGMSAEFIWEARSIVTEAARVVTPAVRLDAIKEDPSDNRILLKNYDDGIRIVTASAFLDVKHAQARDR